MLFPCSRGSAASWKPGESEAEKDARLAWWADARFGMFVHWGLYSIPADGEWHMRNTFPNMQAMGEVDDFALYPPL
jgi:hypothetical protein